MDEDKQLKLEKALASNDEHTEITSVALSEADAQESTDRKPKKQRSQRPFPAASFEEALGLAKAMHKLAAGQPIRRLTLFDELGKSPESGASRQWIVNANKYGLIKGSYAAEWLELTEDGSRASSEDTPAIDRSRIFFKLGIQQIPTFNSLFERFVNNKLPTSSVLVDSAIQSGTPADLAKEAVETFIVNLKFIGILQTLSGAERIVPLDHVLEQQRGHSLVQTSPMASVAPIMQMATSQAGHNAFQTACFYITAIGSEDSEERRHSDLFLGSLVEPALEEFGLQVLRADGIEEPGMITQQIIEYLVRARLVIADLSFHNPNVFYELAIRHAMRLPTVHIIRKADRIPFDINQFRTIQIDNTDIYSLVPKIETYRAQIASQVRSALENTDPVLNPLTAFYPHFTVHLNEQHPRSNIQQNFN